MIELSLFDKFLRLSSYIIIIHLFQNMWSEVKWLVKCSIIFLQISIGLKVYPGREIATLEKCGSIDCAICADFLVAPSWQSACAHGSEEEVTNLMFG